MKREKNFEVMRTIAMLFVVIHHSLSHGVGVVYGFNADEPIEWINVVSADALLVFGSIAVNLYVMVSGYFLVDLEFKPSRLARTWLSAFFYSFAITLLMMASGCAPFSMTALAKSFFPISVDAYWFVTQFVGLLLLAPFLSMMVRRLTYRQYVVLLIVGALLCLSITPDFPLGKRFSVHHGNSVWSFAYLYIVAGFIKHHLPPLPARKLLWAAAIVALLVLGCELWQGKKEDGVHLLWLDYNGLPFVLSVIIFVLVKQWRTGDGTLSTRLARMAPYTFGVYLIHDHLMIRQWLWTTIDFSSFYGRLLFLPVVAGCCMGIFFVCVVIDVCRQRLFGLLKLNEAMKKLDKWSDVRNLSA
ncbi:MAG: acyltransferase [Prevotella sp.]|nr:acyltransferase [Prevotella sp.]